MRRPIRLTPLPPREALEYFRSKGLAGQNSRFDWRDIWREEHARAFVVAKADTDDILNTIRRSFDDALASGQTMESWRADLTPTLQAAGWWGRGTQRDRQTGELRDVQLGSAHRLRVIFDTNMRTSLAAGRWARIQRTKRAFPYLEYRQIERDTKRDEHVRFHGLIRPVDDPIWERIYPPNGWFCGCSVRQMNDRMLARESKKVTPPQDFDLDEQPYENARTGEVEPLPRGVHPGFDTNPGITWLRQTEAHRRSTLDLPAAFHAIDRTLIRETRLRGLRSGDETLVAYDLDADPGPGDVARDADAGGPEIGWSRSLGDYDPDWQPTPDDPVPPSSRVRPSVAMQDAMRDPDRRLVLIHNHPSSGSFSPADLNNLAANEGMAQIVAAGLDGSIYRAGRTAITARMTQSEVDEIYSTTVSMLMTAMRAGRITRVDASAIHAHLFVEALEAKGLLRYAMSPSGRLRDALARSADVREGILKEFS